MPVLWLILFIGFWVLVIWMLHKLTEVPRDENEWMINNSERPYYPDKDKVA